MVREPWSPAFISEADRCRPARTAIAALTAAFAVALSAHPAHGTPQETASPAASVAPASPTSPANAPSGGSYLDYFRHLVSRLDLPPSPGSTTEPAADRSRKASLDQEGVMPTDMKQKHEPSDNRTGELTKSIHQRAADAWDAIKKAWQTARERLGLRDHSQA